MRTLFCVVLTALPLLGCALYSQPQDSTAHADLQKDATKAQTAAAAGLAVSPIGDSQVCTYDTKRGKVSLVVATADMCPSEPPASAQP